MDPSLLRHLLLNVDEYLPVRLAAARNPSTSLDALHALLATPPVIDDCKHVRRAVADSTRLTDEMFDMVLLDSDLRVHQMLLWNLRHGDAAFGRRVHEWVAAGWLVTFARRLDVAFDEVVVFESLEGLLVCAQMGIAPGTVSWRT